MNRRIFIGAIIFLVLCSLGFAKDKDKDKEKKPNYKKGEIIVRFKGEKLQSQLEIAVDTSLSKRQIRNILSDKVIKNSKVDKQFDKLVPGLVVIKLPPGMTVEEAVTRFNESGVVFYAEPNYKRTISQLIPNDSFFNLQWGLNQDPENQTSLPVNGGLQDADIDAPEAWELAYPDGVADDVCNVNVAVIDTGISTGLDPEGFHEDINNNIWLWPGEDMDVVGEFDANDINEEDGYNRMGFCG
jgi:hypothetical protein